MSVVSCQLLVFTSSLSPVTCSLFPVPCSLCSDYLYWSFLL
ncbi:MAG: hypothetical protein ACKPGQ_23250 [Dolichospermum sp.]